MNNRLPVEGVIIKLYNRAVVESKKTGRKRDILAEKKTKRKKKDRRQRSVKIIAAILAVAMALSAIAAYAGHLLDRKQGETVESENQFDPGAYRDHYSAEIKRLESYLAEYGPAAGVLFELCNNYRLLIRIEKAGGEMDEEKVRGYEAALKQYGRDLVELEPDKLEHRLQLLVYYKECGEDEAAIAGEIEVLRDLLHEHPDSLFSLELIGLMKSLEQPEDDIDAAIARLSEYFEELVATGKMDSENRYYYAYFLAEHLGEKTKAVAQLDLILEAETAETELYLLAEDYRKILQQRDRETGE